MQRMETRRTFHLGEVVDAGDDPDAESIIRIIRRCHFAEALHRRLVRGIEIGPPVVDMEQ